MRNGTVDTLAVGSRLFIALDGSGVVVRDGGANVARVTHADVLVTNGVCHVVDAVLVSESVVDRSRWWTVSPSTVDVPFLVHVALLVRSVPKLSTLASLLDLAGLVDALSGSSLTMFAPTNDAFAKLPEGLVGFLTRPENKQMLVRCRSVDVHKAMLLYMDG